VPDEAGPQRDEERCEVLDQQRHADLEAVDGEEVEPLDERQPADAEEGEERQLARGDPEPARGGHGEEKRQADERAGRAHLGELQRRDPVREDHLRDRSVDGPERGGRHRHHVAEARVPNAGRLDGEGGLGHGCRGYLRRGPVYTSARGT
jgi:hypothetical protein